MEWMALLLFATVIAALLAGFPVAFTLGGTALTFAAVGAITGTFNDALLSSLPNRVFGIMGNETLVAVPLFVFMGVTLERDRRCNGGDDGPVVAADHAAAGLLTRGGNRHHLCLGHARPDHPAVDHPGNAR